MFAFIQYISKQYKLSLPSYLYIVISLCKFLLNLGYPLQLITTQLIQQNLREKV